MPARMRERLRPWKRPPQQMGLWRPRPPSRMLGRHWRQLLLLSRARRQCWRPKRLRKRSLLVRWSSSLAGTWRRRQDVRPSQEWRRTCSSSSSSRHSALLHRWLWRGIPMRAAASKRPLWIVSGSASWRGSNPWRRRGAMQPWLRLRLSSKLHRPLLRSARPYFQAPSRHRMLRPERSVMPQRLSARWQQGRGQRRSKSGWMGSSGSLTKF
mmetsp:Transcript_5765/g.13574  ORF Transcript_5765/g.13574 Transcript_5765/m.13574 type:complete len:211 (-) Transcript_5765:555-1187(-)